MSFKAAKSLVNHIEVEYLKTLSYEEINKIINLFDQKNSELLNKNLELNNKILKLEMELLKLKESK